MDYKKLIVTWHKKALRQKDIFSKFIFEYLSFIALCHRVVYPNSSKDRDAIQSLKQDDRIKARYLLYVKTTRKVGWAWQIITEQLNQHPLGNIASGHNGIEVNKFWKGRIQGLSDWDSFVEFWYTIRNNLFHGGKNPIAERDQILVKNAYLTLRPLITVLIQDNLLFESRGNTPL